MKLYSTLERRSALLAVCPQSLVPAGRVAPSSVSSQWREPALPQALAPVAAAVPAAPLAVARASRAVAAASLAVPAVERAVSAASPAVAVAELAVPASVLVSVQAPSARVAVEATEPVRTEAAVRGAEPATGNDETRIDEIHVASAALLDQRGIRVQGTTGFSAKHGMTAPKPNGGVRGTPPRGRPV